MPAQFRWAVEGGGILLRLTVTTKRLLRTDVESQVLADKWVDTCPHALAALTRLELAVLDGEAGISVLADNSAYHISHAFLASLSDAQAQALGLPSTVPMQLRVEFSGPFSDANTKITAQWHKANGIRVMGNDEGAIIKFGEQHYRLPQSLFELLQKIDQFNDAQQGELDDSLLALSELQLTLSKITGEAVHKDRQMKQLRLSHAASMSLDIELRNTGPVFDPVLFSKQVVDHAQEEGQVLQQEQQLLTPIQQQQFATQFRQQPEVKSTYLIAPGEFLFIDPSLRSALKTVRKAQSAPAGVRSQFAKSPSSFIKQQLIEEGVTDEEHLEELVAAAFVETDRFSERVVEIGLWQPPVIPFAKQVDNEWISEGFGIKIGDTQYILTEQEVVELGKRIPEALAAGETSITIASGASIPISDSMVTAIETLRTAVLKLPPQILPDEVEPKPEDDGNEDIIASGRSAVIVKHNYDGEGYFADRVPRDDYSGYTEPHGLLNTPKDHQVEGIGWLEEAWSVGYSGVLLADDMGLGKTFQTLGFLSWLVEKRKSLGLAHRPIMLVAPTTLLGNWEAEAKIHLSESARGEIHALYGASGLKPFRKPGMKGSDVTSGIPTLDTKKLENAQWILTTYQTMRDYHLSLAQVPLACVVFDEMQNIKNLTSLTTNAAQSLNKDFSIGLTGTPVENSLADLWTLYDTLMPGLLQPLREFLKYYQGDEGESEERLRKLHGHLTERQNDDPPYMLRRMKSDVQKDLPNKHEAFLDKNMPETQANEYAIALSGSLPKIEVFRAMRGISLHPFHPSSEEAVDHDHYVSQSARLVSTVEILDKAHAEGKKALIFIESIDMHEWLAGFLKQRYNMDHYPERIYGSVNAARRTDIVNAFENKNNKGFDLLLLSPKAAGVGITLVAATIVIHLSRWWNPAVEDQCTDRAYRIGQKNDVYVYYPRALHPAYGQSSFDVILSELLDRKRRLSKGTLMPMEDGTEAQTLFDKLQGKAVEE
jgi:SNF2 family DNA or RNA helicase